MLARSLRRWPGTKAELAQRLVSAGSSDDWSRKAEKQAVSQSVFDSAFWAGAAVQWLKLPAY